MTDLIEVSYTGDLLAHRRCRRAWAFEKHVGVHPYEQVQAMEGFMIHHAMQWLTDRHRATGAHADVASLTAQLNSYFLVLWSRGIRTTFASKQETVDRVTRHLYDVEADAPHPEVLAAVEGAQHEEYPLRSVRKVVPELYGGKSKILLTGILDVVIQQKNTLTYPLQWRWTDKAAMLGEVIDVPDQAAVGDTEIWDYKGTRLRQNRSRDDYVRQVVTYAGLLQDRIGLPRRCVLFFTNEKPGSGRRLLSIPIDQEVIDASFAWTLEQVRELRNTVLQIQQDPLSIDGGDLTKQHLPMAQRVDQDLKAQCTACGQRFDCDAYRAFLTAGGADPNDIDRLNVNKN
ncbi:PD-(D/E)XK nuclease family protein [Dactylosporangium darangshiense]|uniref:PD-(D/E)XK endonuclease-like domain-containing protein n=1 Tax=Dactylosporangium darangshiense TaxID=579108 RepID=A0ABP8CU03_9ACTN